MASVPDALSRTRADAGRAVIMATAIGLMAAGGVDLVTGRWVAAPWLHILLAVLCVAAFMPFARRVKYLQLGPLYVLGLLIYTVLRGYADDTPIAPRSDHVIGIEKFLFF